MYLVIIELFNTINYRTLETAQPAVIPANCSGVANQSCAEPRPVNTQHFPHYFYYGHSPGASASWIYVCTIFYIFYRVI